MASIGSFLPDPDSPQGEIRVVTQYQKILYAQAEMIKGLPHRFPACIHVSEGLDQKETVFLAPPYLTEKVISLAWLKSPVVLTGQRIGHPVT